MKMCRKAFSMLLCLTMILALLAIPANAANAQLALGDRFELAAEAKDKTINVTVKAKGTNAYETLALTVKPDKTLGNASYKATTFTDWNVTATAKGVYTGYSGAENVSLTGDVVTFTYTNAEAGEYTFTLTGRSVSALGADGKSVPYDWTNTVTAKVTVTAESEPSDSEIESEPAVTNGKAAAAVSAADVKAAAEAAKANNEPVTVDAKTNENTNSTEVTVPAADLKANLVDTKIETNEGTAVIPAADLDKVTDSTGSMKLTLAKDNVTNDKAQAAAANNATVKAAIANLEPKQSYKAELSVTGKVEGLTKTLELTFNANAEPEEVMYMNGNEVGLYAKLTTRPTDGATEGWFYDATAKTVTIYTKHLTEFVFMGTPVATDLKVELGTMAGNNRNVSISGMAADRYYIIQSMSPTKAYNRLVWNGADKTALTIEYGIGYVVTVFEVTAAPVYDTFGALSNGNGVSKTVNVEAAS